MTGYGVDMGMTARSSAGVAAVATLAVVIVAGAAVGWIIGDRIAREFGW